MDRYAEAQSRWVPVPDIHGLSAPGCTMRAGVFRSPEYDAGGTPGIAIVFVQGPTANGDDFRHRAACVRRAVPVAAAVRNRERLTLAPLDYPRVPWVARRPDGDLARDAALAPYLAEFERVLTWSYLQFLAFVDATRKKDGAGDPG